MCQHSAIRRIFINSLFLYIIMDNYIYKEQFSLSFSISLIFIQSIGEKKMKEFFFPHAPPRAASHHRMPPLCFCCFIELHTPWTWQWWRRRKSGAPLSLSSYFFRFPSWSVLSSFPASWAACSEPPATKTCLPRLPLHRCRRRRRRRRRPPPPHWPWKTIKLIGPMWRR